MDFEQYNKCRSYFHRLASRLYVLVKDEKTRKVAAEHAQWAMTRAAPYHTTSEALAVKAIALTALVWDRISKRDGILDLEERLLEDALIHDDIKTAKAAIVNAYQHATTETTDEWLLMVIEAQITKPIHDEWNGKAAAERWAYITSHLDKNAAEPYLVDGEIPNSTRMRENQMWDAYGKENNDPWRANRDRH